MNWATVDWPTAIVSAAGAITAVITYFTGRSQAKKSLIGTMEQRLHDVTKQHMKCEDRLSAIESELVTLRKLLPGGEWYRKLGLDEYPNDQ